MKKIYTTLAITLLACSPLLSTASTFSSKIALTGGDISPNQDLEIFFNNLLESVVYTVQCDTITSNGKSKQANDFIALYSADFYLVPSINGNYLMSHPWQASISTTETNNLNLKNVTRSSASIIIRNLDDTDTISVKNCYALPQV